MNPPKAVPPKAVQTPDPEYTEKARKRKLEGTTNLLVVVNEKGYPGIVELMKDLGEGLDVGALAAVAEWTFKPAMRNGLRVAAMVIVEITFRFD